MCLLVVEGRGSQNITCALHWSCGRKHQTNQTVLFYNLEKKRKEKKRKEKKRKEKKRKEKKRKEKKRKEKKRLRLSASIY